MVICVAVCIGLTVLVVAINPGSRWWVFGGIVLGVVIGWIIAAVRNRRWLRLAIVLGLVVGAAAPVVLFRLLFIGASGPGGQSSYRSVRLSATMQYRADKNLFDITDTLLLTDKGSMAVCQDNQRLAAEGEPRADCSDAVARNAYARTSVEKAGWTYKDDFNDYHRFTRHREVAVDVPQWWPLSVTRSVDPPNVRLENSWLVADEHSAVTISGPKNFIINTVPRKLSKEDAVDGTRSEITKIPISADEAGGWDSEVRLQLASWDARNPVIASLVDFSWSRPIKWILALFATVVVAAFSDELKGLILRFFGALGRCLGLRPKPDVETPGTPTDEAGGTVSHDARTSDGGQETPPVGRETPPVGPSPVVGNPPSPATD